MESIKNEEATSPASFENLSLVFLHNLSQKATPTAFISCDVAHKLGLHSYLISLNLISTMSPSPFFFFTSFSFSSS